MGREKLLLAFKLSSSIVFKDITINFLGIKGAFNHVLTDSIARELDRKRAPPSLCKWMETSLNNRIIGYTYLVKTTIKAAVRKMPSMSTVSYWVKFLVARWPS